MDFPSLMGCLPSRLSSKPTSLMFVRRPFPAAGGSRAEDVMARSREITVRLQQILRRFVALCFRHAAAGQFSGNSRSARLLPSFSLAISPPKPFARRDARFGRALVVEEWHLFPLREPHPGGRLRSSGPAASLAAELPGGGVKDQGYKATEEFCCQAHGDLAESSPLTIPRLSEPAPRWKRPAGRTSNSSASTEQPEGKQAIKKEKSMRIRFSSPDADRRRNSPGDPEHFAGEALACGSADSNRFSIGRRMRRRIRA